MRIACATNLPNPTTAFTATGSRGWIRRMAVLITMIALGLFWLVPAGASPVVAAGQDSGEALEMPGELPSPPHPAPPLNTELKETTSLFLVMVKAMAALAVVLGLIVLMTRWLKRLGWGSDHPGGGSLIKVLETKMIAPKKYVAILQVTRELLVVGVTDQQINLLAKLEHPDSLIEELAARQSGAPQNSSFAAMLRKACGGKTS